MTQCMDCYGKEFCQYNYCPVVKDYILRTSSPNKGKTMNDIAVEAAVVPIDHKHYVLTIDPETGKEVRVELLPIEGEFSQETEGDETVTIH